MQTVMTIGQSDERDRTRKFQTLDLKTKYFLLSVLKLRRCFAPSIMFFARKLRWTLINILNMDILIDSPSPQAKLGEAQDRLIEITENMK